MLETSRSQVGVGRADSILIMDATAMITGGTGGLGTAVVGEFLSAGWRVVVPWVAEEELKRLPEAPHLVTTQADLSDAVSAQEAVALAAGSPRAPLRALVNLVGGFASGGRVHETPVEEFEQQLQVNLRPLYVTTQAALVELLASGGGSVVCVSSRSALRPFSGGAGYVTAKAAVLALADTLAVEYGKDNIRVNTVVPDVIDTPANRSAQPDADYSTWVAPERIAQVIRFLCEDSSDAVSGGHIPVYGPRRA
jgi:NAD(P)-dependent dehydrogenase (short-subunit alcohol dehydrogenase family)